MSRKKKRGEEGIDETWLIPYSDLMTLLLALFIVLFASSQVDPEKYVAMMTYFYNTNKPTISIMDPVGPGGFRDQIYSQFDLDPETGEKIIDTKPDNPNDNPPNPPPEPPGTPGNPGDNKQLEELTENIEKYIEDNNLGESIHPQMDGDELLITLDSDIMFPSGSADIGAAQRETARTLGDMITASYAGGTNAGGTQIVVTGHTDNVPISSGLYKSNWYLSVARAVNFLGIMMEDSNLPPQIYSARGYGEFKPVDTNDTPEGRAKNRRVEVLITVNGATQQ
jgi:chemotaxis protein MotB